MGEQREAERDIYLERGIYLERHTENHQSIERKSKSKYLITQAPMVFWSVLCSDLPHLFVTTLTADFHACKEIDYPSCQPGTPPLAKDSGSNISKRDGV